MQYIVSVMHNAFTQVSATDSLARKEVRKCGITERGNGVKECDYISNVRDTRNVLNVTTACTILLNSAPQLVSVFNDVITACTFLLNSVHNC